MGKETLRDLLQLYSYANSSEVVVGWYATQLLDASSHFDEKSYLLQDFFASESEDPIHLLLDIKNECQFKAFRCIALDEDEQEEKVIADFKELRVETVATSLATSFLITRKNGESTINRAVEEYQSNLSAVKAKLRDGTLDEASKKEIEDILSNCPDTTSAQFAQNFNKSLHDLLMVSYLANLTKAQLKLAEKIN